MTEKQIKTEILGHQVEISRLDTAYFPDGKQAFETWVEFGRKNPLGNIIGMYVKILARNYADKKDFLSTVEKVIIKRLEKNRKEKTKIEQETVKARQFSDFARRVANEIGL